MLKGYEVKRLHHQVEWFTGYRTGGHRKDVHCYTLFRVKKILGGFLNNYGLVFYANGMAF